MLTLEDTKDSFVREDRYIVIKRTDLESALKLTTYYTQQQIVRSLDEIAHLVDLARKGREFRTLVVEHDWPEYEPTWKAIQNRVEGTEQFPVSDSRQFTLEDEDIETFRKLVAHRKANLETHIARLDVRLVPPTYRNLVVDYKEQIKKLERLSKKIEEKA